MPVYVLRCEEGHVAEELLGVESAPPRCPECGGPRSRVPQPFRSSVPGVATDEGEAAMDMQTKREAEELIAMGREDAVKVPRTVPRELRPNPPKRVY